MSIAKGKLSLGVYKMSLIIPLAPFTKPLAVHRLFVKVIFATALGEFGLFNFPVLYALHDALSGNKRIASANRDNDFGASTFFQKKFPD
jgi:hypothetical protein